MKFLRLTFLLALVGGFCLMSSCNKGSDPKPSIEKKNLALLSKTWVVKEVTLGQSDMTDLYANMELTISGTYNKDINTLYNYTITGRPSGTNNNPWPASGTWKFKDGVAGASATTIVRTEDNLDMFYGVTATQLQLIFDYQGDGYSARTSAINGVWTFDFEPK
jgi:hypothetical protein